MMQPLHEIETHYNNPDPWGYQTNADDQFRKEQIIRSCKLALPARRKEFYSALDIGAGEGWITRDLPAEWKHGFEVSVQARARFPAGVIPVSRESGQYELVTACGVLYPQYDTDLFFRLMRRATRIVVTCNIHEWEIAQMKDDHWVSEKLGLLPVMTQQFAYREFHQQLRVFKVKFKEGSKLDDICATNSG